MDIIRRPAALMQRSLLSDFDKLFDDMFEPLSLSHRQFSTPSIDIYRDDNQLIVEAQAPGFTQDDIDISVDNGVLEVRGEKVETDEHSDKKKRSYVVRENATSFYRSVPLPDGADTDNIAAELENGLLRVSVPVAKHDAKRIQIKAGKKSQGQIAAQSKS